MRARGASLGAVLAVVAAILPAAPAAAGATSQAWTQVPAETISGQSLAFNAVTIPQAGDVWVIGQSYDSSLNEWRTLAEHLRGSRFVIVPTPDRETAPAVDFLSGAATATPNDIWAVGDSATSSPSGSDATLIEHWDGTAWRIVTSPNPGNLANILTSVSVVSANDVWSVGASQDNSSFYQRPLAVHWDGSAWSPVTFPNPAGCDQHSFLSGVSAVAASDVWASGWCEESGVGNEAYVGHWNGTNWSLVGGAGQFPVGSQANAVSATGPHNVWVVGQVQAPGSQAPVPLAAHWDGSTWSLTSVGGVRLTGVTTSAPNGVWTVGVADSRQPPFAAPFIAQWYRGGWHGRRVPVAYGSLAGVAAEPGGPLWAAGASLGHPLVVVRR